MSKVPHSDNINRKRRQINKLLCVKNNFAYVDYDNTKPRQHSNYGAIHLNTVVSKTLAIFILALSQQTWQRNSQVINASNNDTATTESNSKFTKNSSWYTLESKSENSDYYRNGSFPILKKSTSRHPKNLFSDTWILIKSERTLNQLEKSFKIHFWHFICLRN